MFISNTYGLNQRFMKHKCDISSLHYARAELLVRNSLLSNAAPGLKTGLNYFM